MPPVACEICVYANEHGSWPTDHRGTHCRECHRSWSGKREVHCAACCLHFSADSVADKHYVRGQCLDPIDMLTRTAQNGDLLFRADQDARGQKIWRHGASLPVISKPRWAAE